MDINILELSSLEVDEKIPESADQYYPTFLRISDVSRVAEGLTNPIYRTDIIKQLTTVLARLPIIWAIRDAEAKLRELGTEKRYPDRTCHRLKDFADYIYHTKNRQKDKDYIEKQKLLRTVDWRVFRFHSIAFSIEKTRNMNLNRLRQVVQLEEACIESRAWGRYLNRMEFNNALAIHASEVRYGQSGLYDQSYEAFKAAQPEMRVEQIPKDLQDELSSVVVAEHQDPPMHELHGQVYQLSAADLRDTAYSYKGAGKPIIMTVPVSIRHPPFILFTTTNTMTMKFMQRPIPQNDQMSRLIRSVVTSWSYQPLPGECWVCSPQGCWVRLFTLGRLRLCSDHEACQMCQPCWNSRGQIGAS